MQWYKLFVRVVIYTTLLLLPFGCATTGKYEQILQLWMGQDVHNLIDVWGPPSNKNTTPNREKMYTWLFVDGTLVTANYNYYLNMTTARSETYWCKTTFTVSLYDIVMNWRWEGNDCQAR